MAYLEHITSPKDIKTLSEEQLKALCAEIRQTLIRQVTSGGGHLASNLGVVEMTLAIHRVFDSPKDHVIFDVGHQSYVHKLLTGRAAEFSTLRAPGGLSGFPKREESPHDAFGTGHASTSLSAGLGFAQADRLQGNDSYTVVVMGDGAFTGGMIHEALNNCRHDLRLILIINENEMSISKNIGHFAQQLARLRARPGYLKTKSAVGNVLECLPLVGKPARHGLSRMKKALKNSLYGSNYFENMGLKYLGPADGNDIGEVEALLRRAKESGRACVLHLKTVKGKGYEPAMQAPDRYHAVQPQKSTDTEEQPTTFSKVFGETLTVLADENKRLCAITAAMKHGTGLVLFGAKHPDRLFDVGIAEEHAVTFAAGLAANGYLPVVAVYSTFLQRAYDSILHDVALQQLPVLFCIDRAGLNAADGPTHYGIFDVAFLMQAGNIEIWEPTSYGGLQEVLKKKCNEMPSHPCAIRYPSGKESALVNAHFSSDKQRLITDGVLCDFDPQTPPKTVILTAGRICEQAIRVKEKLGESCGIVLMQKLYPFDAVVAYIKQHKPERLLILEEGILQGGWAVNLAEAIREAIGNDAQIPALHVFAIRTPFVSPQKGQTLLQAMKLDAAHILAEIKA
ncbi:MAG: 1-deoxy-D-xylulose-5-phosphate synthase [Clostridia bacterium]|nr:1-deoxy-D-xylulose-5-phosphate synthase [Clostridia bacterium]